MISRRELRAMCVGWAIGGITAYAAARYNVDLWAALIVCLTVTVLATFAMTNKK